MTDRKDVTTLRSTLDTPLHCGTINFPSDSSHENIYTTSQKKSETKQTASEAFKAPVAVHESLKPEFPSSALRVFTHILQRITTNE